MIVFSTVAGDGERCGRVISHLPGLEGTRELYDFCKALGVDFKRAVARNTPDEHVELRARTLQRAETEGARELPETDIAEVLLYKRYLHASSAQDRIDRRLVARTVIALVEFGYAVERAADAAAANFGLGGDQAGGEILAAMEAFTGGYATWRDDPGTPTTCSRCRREFLEPECCERCDRPRSFLPGDGGCSCDGWPVAGESPRGRHGVLEPDVDGFYRCEACQHDVRQNRYTSDLMLQLARGGLREVN